MSAPIPETGMAIQIDAPKWLKFARAVVSKLPFPQWTPATQLREIIFIKTDGTWVKYKPQ